MRAAWDGVPHVQSQKMSQTLPISNLSDKRARNEGGVQVKSIRKTSNSHRRMVLKQLGAAALSPLLSSGLVRHAMAAHIRPTRFGLPNPFTGASAAVWAREQ